MKRTARAVVCGFLWAVCACPSVSAALLWQQSATSPSDVAQPPASPAARAAFEPSATDVARVASTSAVSRFEGLRVRDIQFRGAAAGDLDRLRSLLPLQVNERLNRTKLRQSIQALFQTGKFADIQVEAERTSAAEVSLVFVARENYFVGNISINGAPDAPPAYNQLVSATKLQLGELFTQEKVDRAISRLKQTLEDNGYYRVAIKSELKEYASIQQVDIIFHITADKRARIGNVMVRGNPGYSVKEIQKIAKFKTGDEVSAPRITSALERLRKRYQKNQRLEAEVSLGQRVYQLDTHTVDFTFQIDRGPKVEIQVEGASIRKGLLKKYVPVYEENAVDDDLLNEGRRNLRDYFQTKGYFDVQIDFAQQTRADTKYVIYDVETAEKHKLVAIEIEGNRAFSDDVIRERLKIRPAGVLLRHGLFSQTMLSRDVESIEYLYRSNGYRSVSVSTEVQDDYQGKTGHMRVLIRIAEGPQWLISAFKIEGIHSISDEVVGATINAGENQPFSEDTLARDRDALLTEYFSRGFPNAQFESIARQVSSDPPRVELVYKIIEGPQVFVDRVVISGLRHTKPWVVTRELEIYDDVPLDQTAMLRSQSKLYDVGIFNEVDVAVQNPDGLAPSKNVLMQMEEARRYTFNYGVGFEFETGNVGGAGQNPQGDTGVSPRVSFDMTRLNFLGRDHTITFKSRVSRLQQRGLLSYEFPWFLNRPNWKLSFTTFYDTTRDVNTYTAQRLEGSVQAEQRFSRASTFLYRFTYRRVKVDASTLAIDPNLIPLLSQPVRVGMPAFTYIYDTRDDPIDSHRGLYATVDMGVSASIFGSEADFSRVLFTNSTYHQLKNKRWVLARSTKIGVEGPYGNSTFIPLPELLYAGGASSHRGFAINQAGPRDLETGFPLGGEAMFINQIELRFEPLPLPFLGQNLSPVVFHDMGNVFTSGEKMLSGLIDVTQDSRQLCQQVPATSCDFDYTSHSAGLGFRYRTPIGPVRVDFSYNLNPPTFPINQENRFDRLRRFNFFFSIGQTF